jgi:hypothetical protein
MKTKKKLNETTEVTMTTLKPKKKLFKKDGSVEKLETTIYLVRPNTVGDCKKPDMPIYGDLENGMEVAIYKIDDSDKYMLQYDDGDELDESIISAEEREALIKEYDLK